MHHFSDRAAKGGTGSVRRRISNRKGERHCVFPLLLVQFNKRRNEKKKIKTCIKFYKKRKNTISYACYDHMKTISKLSITNNINEYDYISKLKCTADIMKAIDDCIIKEYTI